MSSETKIQRLHIELSRVQTWLFAVPRLRAMVGANALLGEILRDALPKLAREARRGWALAPSETYPTAHPDDPLKDHDDPSADAKDGILARDGGHFEAWFASGAGSFAEAAGQLLRTRLPGLRFHVSIDREPLTKSQVHIPTELPVLAPCEWSGRGLASDHVKQGDEHPAVSLEVTKRHNAANRVEDGTAVDVASLLSKKTKLKDLKRAQELQELVGDGYLALIHADGNSVGSSRPRDNAAGDARFFHRNRVLLRRALKSALEHACELDAPRRNAEKARAEEAGKAPKVYAPLMPLMLGGDDLLLVCRAAVALPFVVTLCAALEDLQRSAEGFKLTLGVGVVVAKHTIPIHHLHEVAEQLASSAKRRFRNLERVGQRSVVDWAVYRTAWVDDPAEVRRRDWLSGSGDERRVLSQRPVDVLGQGLDSLQGLVRGAERIAKAPRSQLRYLVDQLPRGRALAELAYSELPREAKDPLEALGVTTPWRRGANNGPWLTALLDLIEISEIARLGRNTEHVDTRSEATHV